MLSAKRVIAILSVTYLTPLLLAAPVTHDADANSTLTSYSSTSLVADSTESTLQSVEVVFGPDHDLESTPKVNDHIMTRRNQGDKPPLPNWNGWNGVQLDVPYSKDEEDTSVKPEVEPKPNGVQLIFPFSKNQDDDPGIAS